MIICNFEAKVKGFIFFLFYFFLCSFIDSSLMFTLHIHHGHYIPHSCVVNVTTNKMTQVMNNQRFSLVQADMKVENELSKNTY